MVKFWSSLRLHVQLAVAGGFLLAVTISIVTWINIQNMKSELIQKTTIESTALAKSLSIISTKLVLTNKYDELESLLIQSASFPGILAIKIASMKGQTLSHVMKLDTDEVVAVYDLSTSEVPAQGTNSVVSKIDWQTKRLDLWYPIATSSPIGWVEMQVSLKDMAALQRETIVDNIKSAVTAIILDILVIILILYKPASNLRKVVKFASSLVDKPGTQLGFSGSSVEVERLIKALNESSVKLQIQQTQIFKKTQMLKRIASVDHLTQIPNRSIFMDRLENAIKLAKRNNSEFIVIFLDLNDFKPVNDNFGHHIGDTLLQQVASRLKSCIRESDSLARYGGDEFIIMLTNVTSEVSLSEIIENLRKAVSKDYEIEGKIIKISVSIGQAKFPVDGTSSDELLTKADNNMYKEKREFKQLKA